MTWPTHSAIALSSLWLLYVVEPEAMRSAPGLVLGSALLGALLPDLDATDSKLQRLTLPYCAIRPFHLFSRLVRLTSAHRGWMHSLRGLLIASLLAAFCVISTGTFFTGVTAWGIFTLGYASHLLADMATPAGIPLCYPRRQRWHLLPRPWRIATASMEEEVVFVVFACLTLSLLLRMMSNPLL